MTAQGKARGEMLLSIAKANHHIARIERLARQADIRITVNFGAELAYTHDALTELEEQIRKL